MIGSGERSERLKKASTSENKNRQSVSEGGPCVSHGKNQQRKRLIGAQAEPAFPDFEIKRAYIAIGSFYLSCGF
jgi:hypothetical protein